MKLSEMTTDESIAYTVGRVPGCAEGVTWDFHMGGCAGPTEQIERALWFRAAWVWLEKRNASSASEIDIRVESLRAGAWRVSRGRRECGYYSDEVKALCAAVLLAAGEAVP